MNLILKVESTSSSEYGRTAADIAAAADAAAAAAEDDGAAEDYPSGGERR